jgi:hypothetical protein
MFLTRFVWLKALAFPFVLSVLMIACFSGDALACMLTYQVSKPEDLIQRSTAIYLARAERGELLPQE